MDDRSRKLLSNQALPKAKLPEPRPHAKREFKLPSGVAPRAASPSLSELRAQALAPAPLADGSGAQKTGAKSMAPAAPLFPALGTPMPAGPATASTQAAPSGKARRQASQPSVPPAPPIPPPIPMSAKKKGPAAAVVPVKKAKLPKLVSFDQGHTPAPQPKPKLIPGRATAPTPALVVASAEAPTFREATSMWFRAGDEEAARAVREAEEDAAERAAQARFAGFTRTHALLAAAGGALAVILLIAFL